jgi:hypothetical protein
VTPAPRSAATPRPTLASTSARTLTLEHKPIQRAALGSQKFVEVTTSVPEGTEIRLYFGVPGGLIESKPMRDLGEGLFRCTLAFPATGKLEYWIVARNRDTEPSRAMSGSRFDPHTILIY